MLTIITSLAPHILQASLQVRLRRLNLASKMCASVLRATARLKRGKDHLQCPSLSVPLMVQTEDEGSLDPWIPAWRSLIWKNPADMQQSLHEWEITLVSYTTGLWDQWVANLLHGALSLSLTSVAAGSAGVVFYDCKVPFNNSHQRSLKE